MIPNTWWVDSVECPQWKRKGILIAIRPSAQFLSLQSKHFQKKLNFLIRLWRLQIIFSPKKVINLCQQRVTIKVLAADCKGLTRISQLAQVSVRLVKLPRNRIQNYLLTKSPWTKYCLRRNYSLLQVLDNFVRKGPIRVKRRKIKLNVYRSWSKMEILTLKSKTL